MIAYARSLTGKFPLVFIEDLLDENDWEGYSKAVRELDRTIVLGDDLTVTNVEFLKKAHALRAIEGFVLKPNQVGTITEALDAYRFACEHGMIAVPSGRSGGVVDDVVMDLSVGLQVPISEERRPPFRRTYRKVELSDAGQCSESGMRALRHLASRQVLTRRPCIRDRAARERVMVVRLPDMCH